uniref:Uncharacterized protein n=1 Tax=Amphimedon queenslandica TaxID=400682 RepID=A0A1X7U997_AMPQE
MIIIIIIIIIMIAKDAEKNEILNLYGIFNSGTLGGSRHILLSLLSRMIL